MASGPEVCAGSPSERGATLSSATFALRMPLRSAAIRTHMRKRALALVPGLAAISSTFPSAVGAAHLDASRHRIPNLRARMSSANSLGGRSFSSDIKPPHPMSHSDRSDPAFSSARSLCAGSRSEDRRPIASRLLRAMNLSSVCCRSVRSLRMVGGRAAGLRRFGFGAGPLSA